MKKTQYLAFLSIIFLFIVIIFLLNEDLTTAKFTLSKRSTKNLNGDILESLKNSGIEVLNLSQILSSGEFSYSKYVIKPKIQNDSLSLILNDNKGNFFSRYRFNNITSGFFNFFDSDGNRKEYYLFADTRISQNQADEKSYIIKFKDVPLTVERQKLTNETEKKVKELEQNVSKKLMKLSDANNKIKSLKIELNETLKNYEAGIKITHDQFKAMLNLTSDKRNLREFDNVFNGISLHLSKSELEEVKDMPNVESVYEDVKVHSLLNDSVGQINATAVWNMLDENGRNVTGYNVTIAIVDTGIDYTHPDFGGCSAIGVTYTPKQPEGYILESPHPYTNKYNNIWTISRTGFNQISVHFVNISVESGYDYVKVLDSSNNTVATYTGSKYDIWTPPVQGNTVRIQLTSDYSITDYGFYIDEISNGTTTVTSSCKVVGGYDFVNNDNDPMDDMGHGTHCADIAAGNGTLKGVAPGAKLLAYKVLDEWGSGYESDIISGIEKAVDDSADVISMSLGKDSGTPDDPLSEAIDNAVNSSVVAVIAAGNSGPSFGTIATPANSRRAITVGAVDKSNSIAYFSSIGPVVWNSSAMIKPDVVAPGVGICSAELDSFYASYRCIDNRHIALSGTSMATPHVAGAVALLKQLHRNWTADEIKSALITTSTDLGYDVVTQGGGLVNMLKAINSSIMIEPGSINANFVGDVSPINNTTIIIKNTRPYQISVNLTIENATDQYGGSYNVSYLNSTNITIDANSEGAALLTFNMTDQGGVFFGKVKLTADGENYTVPYLVSWLRVLNVSAVANGMTLYPDFYVHTDGLKDRSQAYNGWDFYGQNYSFFVPANKNVTIYAVGDIYNETLNYIMMKKTESSTSGTNIVLNLSNDSRPFTINATSLNGDDIKIYELEFGFVSYVSDTSPLKVLYSYSTSLTGDQVVYLSNKPDGPYDTDIILKYVGVPVKS